jgi:protein-disulfide isomerase
MKIRWTRRTAGFACVGLLVSISGLIAQSCLSMTQVSASCSSGIATQAWSDAQAGWGQSYSYPYGACSGNCAVSPTELYMDDPDPGDDYACWNQACIPGSQTDCPVYGQNVSPGWNFSSPCSDICLTNGTTCNYNEDCCSLNCSQLTSPNTCQDNTGGGNGGGENCIQDGDPCWNTDTSCCTDYWQCGNDGNCDPPDDPILIDTTGNGYSMTSAADGVLFPASDGAKPTKMSWTAADSADAWLALDLNGNGRIDNMTELFSNFMPIPGSSEHAANGFAVLAAYDLPHNGGNGDGVISAKDAIYGRLLLWIDKNHNGISEPDELFTMSQLGIASINLKYRLAKSVDQYGDVFRYRSAMADTAGFHTGSYAYDVILKTVTNRPRVAAAPKGPASLAAKVAPSQLVAGDPPSRGPANARVTVAVFSDFQCPFCAKAAGAMDELMRAYGDDVRVVYRYYPLSFHQWAQPAARSAACANEQGADAFWKLHNLYFTHQSQMSANNVAARSIELLEAVPGFDISAFRRCLAAPASNPAVERDLRLGAVAGVTGTPTIFVNGERVQGVPAMIEAVGQAEGVRRAVAFPPAPAEGAACPRPAIAARSRTSADR